MKLNSKCRRKVKVYLKTVILNQRVSFSLRFLCPTTSLESVSYWRKCQDWGVWVLPVYVTVRVKPLQMLRSSWRHRSIPGDLGPSHVSHRPLRSVLLINGSIVIYHFTGSCLDSETSCDSEAGKDALPLLSDVLSSLSLLRPFLTPACVWLPDLGSGILLL